MTTFSCVPCLLGFQSRAEYIEHLKSDLHTYNLRRQVAELGPVTAEEFQRKLQILQESADVIPKAKKRCGRLGKGAAVNATSLLKRPGDDSSSSTSSCPQPTKEKTEEPPKKYDPRMSLFDNHESSSFDDNLKYMTERHSFFIHDEQYVIDLRAFVKYLGGKVYEGHQCLQCNRPFRSVAAVWRHMEDRGHKRIGVELEEQQDEYSEFYDYSTSYRELNLPESVSSKLQALTDTASGDSQLKARGLAPVVEEPAAVEGNEDSEGEWECVAEYEEGEDGDAVLISEVINDVKTTWAKQLAAAGFKAAYIDADDNLQLPTMRKEILHRKHMRQGKLLTMRSRAAPTTRAVKMIAEDGQNALQEQRLIAIARRAKKSSCRVQNKTDMRLGVKANTLYRHIARKNKIFL